MNVPKKDVYVHAEMSIRDYRENANAETFSEVKGGLKTMKELGLLTDPEFNGYVARLDDISKAFASAHPAPTERSD